MFRLHHGSAAVLLVGLLAVGLCAPVSAQKSGAARVEAMADSLLDQLWVLTDMHWHKGEYNHNIHLSRMIIAGRPDNLDAYANSAWLLWSMNRDNEAVAMYKQGIQANPNTYYMYDELAYYYLTRKRDREKALPYYEKAASFKDCPASSLHMLAHCYEKTGRLEKALATWKRAAAIPDRSDAPIKHLQANAQRHLKRVQQLVDQRAGSETKGAGGGQ